MMANQSLYIFLILAGILLGSLTHIGAGVLGCRRRSSLRFVLTVLFFAAAVPGLYFLEVDRNSASILFNADTLETLRTRFGIHLFMLTVMALVSLIDFEQYVIPDLLMIPATVTGAVLMTIFPGAALPDYDFHPFTGALLHHPLTAFAGTDSKFRLAVTIGALFFWVFALLDRRWYARLGLKRAGILFLRRLGQSRLTLVLPLIGLAATTAIWILYRHTPFETQESMERALLSAMTGLAASMLLIWGVRIIGGLVMGREAMGFGDVILMGFLGLFFGWQGGIILFFLAPIAGLLFGLARLFFKTNREIPYGPFLCLSALGVLVFWEPILFQVHDFLIGPLAAAILLLMGVLMAILLWVIQIVKRIAS